jgi:hypothetical protein
MIDNDASVTVPRDWDGEDSDSDLPNFEFKPTGYQLNWYKYALRSARANREISRVEFFKMVAKCIESLDHER